MRVVLFPSAYASAVGGVKELTRQLAARSTAQGDAVEVWTIRNPVAFPPDEVMDVTRARQLVVPMPRTSAAGFAGFPAAATFALVRLIRSVKRARPDVRVYGSADFVARLEAAGFEVTQDPEVFTAAEIRRYRLAGDIGWDHSYLCRP